ncbi:hypothetical protein P153DRAFT_211067 [Dothidotthia symphoricarpi CBS 119687]|uniref:Uncharacterized protein n=1 Tax=Dothidotthia symphoricarpi CBS 119687 TaxID=1392245 RepID=A0A6A6AIP3_9PLEO|nr:uncharacterized protein P153DRAFT_211067 [Dothidotthia symphoricarpi CBS 119687]KAF2131103.1 hypothetical protein P153DRAFT_211067 [Dothidotthia symphoricarpi CBS 119687]
MRLMPLLGRDLEGRLDFWCERFVPGSDMVASLFAASRQVVDICWVMTNNTEHQYRNQWTNFFARAADTLLCCSISIKMESQDLSRSDVDVLIRDAAMNIKCEFPAVELRSVIESIPSAFGDSNEDTDWLKVPIVETTARGLKKNKNKRRVDEMPGVFHKEGSLA